MKNLGLKISWLLPLLLATTGLFITGLGDSAPEAQAVNESGEAVEMDQISSSSSSSAENPAEEKSAEGVAEQKPVEVGSAAAVSEAPKGPELAKLSVSQSGRITSKGCLTDEAAIDDMQKLKAELEEKTKALAKREAELQARETALAEELKKIEAVRDEIKAVNQVSIGKNEEKINRLAETFEAMSPKAAAAVVNNIEQSLAVASLQKISAQKLAKILAAMDPNDSGAMTEAMAGVVRVSRKSPKGEKRASSDASETAMNPGKGGEQENGNENSQQRQPANRGPTPATGG